MTDLECSVKAGVDRTEYTDRKKIVSDNDNGSATVRLLRVNKKLALDDSECTLHNKS